MSPRPEGFTLLEMIIAIIIVGVLASLALPRLFRTIEFSRATEALNNLGTIRRAMDRCMTFSGGVGDTCVDCLTWDALAMEDPVAAPQAHFDYSMTFEALGGRCSLKAQRNTVDGGDGTSYIMIFSNAATKVGVGVFAGIR